MKKQIALLLVLAAFAGCAHIQPSHKKAEKNGTLSDIHPIIKKHGEIPVVKPDLPSVPTISYNRRRLDMERKYSWIKTRVSGNFKDTPLYAVLDLMIPEGRIATYGDVDYRTPISAEFDNVPLDIALDRVLKPIGADYIPHRDSMRITRTVKAIFRLPIPDVQNQATGMVGNMLTSGGGMSGGMPGGGLTGGMPGGGMSGGMPGGGLTGGMPGGGMSGGMPGGGSTSSSSGILTVNSVSGMTPFWQAVVSSINGMVSGNCAPPLAVYTNGVSMSGSSMQGGYGQMQPGGGAYPQGSPMMPQGGNPPIALPNPGYGPSINGYGPAGQVSSGGSASPAENRPGTVSPGSMFSGIACGHVKVDSNTGYIYIWDTVENVYDIGTYIDKIKKMLKRQVYLKVDIIEVQLNAQNQYGINWGAVLHGLGAGLGATLTSGAAANAGLALTGNQLTPYSMNVSNGSGVTALVEALSSYGTTHIVNQPRILTISGQPTTINVTQNIPYLQSEMPFAFGGLNSSSIVIPQIGYVNTGLTLEMLPEIDNDKVRLHVVPVLNTLTQFINISVANLGTFQEPEVDSRATSNDIIIRSNEAVFFGGLIADSINDQYWSVPFFGSIPGLKWLFSGYNKIRQVDELVFVITPIITENGHQIETTIPSTHDMMHYHQDSNGIRLTPQKGISVGPSS